jgi:hypothetical protein
MCMYTVSRGVCTQLPKTVIQDEGEGLLCGKILVVHTNDLYVRACTRSNVHVCPSERARGY